MVAMMKNWQFYAIQSNLMIVASLAATSTVAKAVFMVLAILYLVMQFLAYKAESNIDTYRITKP